MAINFPGSLDNFTNPTSASPINSPSHADQHANANDAIEALEAKVGVDGSSVVTSHDYKIAQLQSLVTSAVAGAKSIYQDVRNQSGSAFTKATPVYVSGSEGASGKMLISAASNASEATSSKTMGITTSAISNNSNGQVISEGILEGIDTTGAADGDPVWLGVNGAKIYGLANKPSAPAHLVFLGIVIRGGQANTGSMYVKIQNGFELQEIHNVEISSLINGNILAYDSTTQTWKNTNTLQSTASTIPLVVKASASQSVDIFQIQNGSGNAIFWVNQYGQLVGNQPFYSYNRVFIQPNNTSTQGLIVRGLASQTANLTEWQDSTGANLALMTSGGFLHGTGFRIKQNANSTISSAQGSIEIQGPTVRGLVIVAATSQTANLQEWQDSSGTILNRINSAGHLVASSRSVFGGATSIVSGMIIAAVSQEAAAVPILARGSASQTANLQQWQNSSGTVLASLNSNGSFTTTQGIVATGNYANSFGGSVIGGTILTIKANSASNKAVVIQGAASQTANLQEWQDSAGTVQAYIGANGFINTNNSLRVAGDNISAYRFQGVSDGNYTMNFPGSGNIQLFSATNDTGSGVGVLGIKNATTAPTSNPTTGGILYVGSGALLYRGTSNSSQQIVGADGSVKFTSPAASIVPLIIQHASSPSSSYFEIKNSAGNNIWGINSSGEALTRTTTKFGANIQNDSNNNNNALYVQGEGSGNGIPLYVKITSGTKDIVKFDNGGVVKLSITSDGSLKGGNSNTISVNTASTVDTVALSSFTSMEYTLSIKQGSKIRSSKVLVHTDGTSVDSIEYGIMEMGGGISGILVTASVSSTDAILQVTITDAATTNATVKLIKTML